MLKQTVKTGTVIALTAFSFKHGFANNVNSDHDLSAPSSRVEKDPLRKVIDRIREVDKYKIKESVLLPLKTQVMDSSIPYLHYQLAALECIQALDQVLSKEGGNHDQELVTELFRRTKKLWMKQEIFSAQFGSAEANKVGVLTKTLIKHGLDSLAWIAEDPTATRGFKAPYSRLQTYYKGLPASEN